MSKLVVTFSNERKRKTLVGVTAVKGKFYWTDFHNAARFFLGIRNVLYFTSNVITVCKHETKINARKQEKYRERKA